MLELDGLALNGYSPTLAQSYSPYAIAMEGFDAKPGEKKYQWADTATMMGARLIDAPQRANLERVFPLLIHPRFASALTNKLTNGRPHADNTSWTGAGGAADPTFTSVAGEAYIITDGDGISGYGAQHTFTATAAAYSGGAWVRANSGTIAAELLFDGAAATAFTATTTWQFVKTENVTLTAATRYLQIVQTDAGAVNLYIKRAGVVQSATYPGFFDGASGDAKWTGTAYASTSTALTGETAIARAIDNLAEVGEKAEQTPGGITVLWRPTGIVQNAALTMLAGEVTRIDYDHMHSVPQLASAEYRMIAAPWIEGPEYTAGTFAKAAGAPALVKTITSTRGTLPGRARIVLDNTSAQDQNYVAFGIQHRDTDTAQALVIRAASLVVTNFSGALTAAINEVQTISKTGTVSGGGFTIGLDGQTVSPVYNATAASVQSLLEARSNIGTGNIACTGGPVNTTDVVCTFQGDLAGCNVSLMTLDSSAITGGGTVSIALTTTGVPGYVSATLYAEWTTLCSTGSLGHVGSYRVIARVYDAASTSDIGKASVRLVWGLGDLSSTTTNDAASPVNVGDFTLIDLGRVDIPTVATGTQRWTGTIEAKSTAATASSLRIYDLMLVPLEVADGEVRAVAGGSGTRLVGYDPTFAAASGGLNGDAAALGGNWTTVAGDAVDFQDGTNVVTRTEVSDAANTGRWAVLAATAYTSSEVRITVKASVANAGAIMGVIARYVDASNYLVLHVVQTSATTWTVTLRKRVAGTLTTLYAGTHVLPGDDDVSTPYSLVLTLAVISSGVWDIATELAGGGTATTKTGTDTVLATGGALASGYPGFYDEQPNATACTRSYSGFIAYGLPAAEPAIYNGQSLTFRDDGQVLREISAGSVWAAPARATVANPPMLGPAGRAGLSNRLVIVTSRNNPDLATDPLPDQFEGTVYHTPRHEFGSWAY